MPALSEQRFTAAPDTDMQTPARPAHVNRKAASRVAGAESTQKYRRDVPRVIQAAIDLSGDTRSALFRYRNAPLQTLDYKTAERAATMKIALAIFILPPHKHAMM
ncbi:hypothetical protein G3N96_16360 [Burkholderia sp. Se-20373]|uniref:Uncharacterized protein n=1 Tax=Burkholderia contaminans TaxID=488447 RepID=A0A3N8RD15_9BURK|nr:MULTISPECIES: hypothetical protein [Burkholderia]MBN3746992.1 hypothetical protein [Burkholderia sp. Se-20373]RQT16173.1 hypothetical protein DF051_13505 [Burkholderia contaminans]